MKNKHSMMITNHILERIYDLENSEFMYLVLLTEKCITIDYFEREIRKILPPSLRLEEYIDAFKVTFLSNKLKKETEIIDLCKSSDYFEIFKKRSIELLKENLQKNPKVICYSNEEVSHQLIKDVLRAAYKRNRRVRFIRWYRLFLQ